jgi:hypothetical protein
MKIKLGRGDTREIRIHRNGENNMRSFTVCIPYLILCDHIGKAM